MTALPKSLKCPECKKPFSTPQIMSLHRAQVHKVPGTSKATLALRAKKQREAEQATTLSPAPLPPEAPQAPATPGLYHCSECSFTTTKPRGLAIHGQIHRRDQLGPPSEKALTPTHQNNGQSHPDTIPQATLALALGRFQGLCQEMAREHDLAPRSFASRLAELIYHATVRQ